MSRRRRKRGSVVSLFAFQDVMAAIVGILFFVTILLALLAVDAKSLTPQPTSQSEEALREEIQRVRREAREFRSRSRELEVLLAELPADVSQAVEEVRSLAKTHATLLESVQAQERARVNRRAQFPRLRDSVAKQKTRVQRLQNERDRLGAELEVERRSLARVSYILDRSVGSKTPWLVEVSKRGIAVGARDGGSAVLSFEGAKALDGFSQWAAKRDSNGEYFVLLIKPSGLETAQSTALSLRKAGFEIGIDLTPESWQVFD